MVCRLTATKNYPHRRGLLAFAQEEFHWESPSYYSVKGDPWWRHQMKNFPRYWPFVRGIHRSPVNSPHKSQWRGALMFSLICAWINGWVNNGESGDLRRHRAHCDVIVKPKPYFSYNASSPRGQWVHLYASGQVIYQQKDYNSFVSRTCPLVEINWELDEWKGVIENVIFGNCLRVSMSLKLWVTISFIIYTLSISEIISIKYRGVLLL